MTAVEANTDIEHSEESIEKQMHLLAVDQLPKEINQCLNKAWEAEQDVIFLDNLEEATYIICARILDIKTLAKQAIDSNIQKLSYYKICYDWAGNSVQYLLLWRDIIFECQKALLLVSEGKIEMHDYQELKAKSKSVLEEASSDIVSKLDNYLSLDTQKESEIQKFGLQTNPVTTYKQQLASIPPQCEHLIAQFKSTWNASGLYVLVKSNFSEDFKNQHEGVSEFKDAINQINSTLEFEDKIDIKEVVRELHALNDKHLSDATFREMQKDLEADLKSLPEKQRLVIEINGSKLSFVEINLKQRTSSWLDSEIMPLMNNFYAIRSSVKNQFNLSLSNIKNRIAEDNDQGKVFSKEDLRNVLNTFLKRVDRSEQRVASIESEVNELLQEFSIHKVYNGNFLNLSIVSTLNQYNQSNKQRFNGVKNWLAKKSIFLKRFQASVDEEDRLSISEKLVRVINSRKPDPKSSQYTNIFMTKGYIGSSFMVGRKKELKHVKSIISNWNAGYRGAVMITGTRFSGKTLLAEVIAKKYFSEKYISLSAGKKLQIAGRHLDPTMNLAEQLNFVVKYCLQDKLMIYLDDIHEWRNEEFSLLQNLKAMAKIIDRYSNKIFFLVCLNNWQKEKLNEILQLDNVFQAEINTDTVSVEELYQAVLIRHSATHTEIYDDKGEPLNNKFINQKLKDIHYLTKGNIGESLHRWSNDIVLYDDDKVVYTYNDYVLPSFLNANTSILLKTIIFYGSINEYQLRKLFGPPFQDEYKPILQRMINVGVVNRNIFGGLEINKFITNDVAELLSENTGFTYLNKKTRN